MLADPTLAWAIDALRRATEAMPGVRSPSLLLVSSDEEQLTVESGDVGFTLSGRSDALVLALIDSAKAVEMGGDLGEAVRGADGLIARSVTEVRSIARAFSSVRHDSVWFHDREFWTEYLDWLAYCRFNQFHLALGMQYNYGADYGASDNYLCFAYPFLLDVDGWNVYAQGVDAAERARNLESLQYIAGEVKRRGMRFQLGLWNHAYEYRNNARPWYPIVGLTPDVHAEYCAAALKRLLQVCPDIDGVTLRVHFEGGVPDQGHEKFWDTVFGEIASVGRPVLVDMHAKGVDDALLESVQKPNLRPVLSAKYLAEHMGLPYHQVSVRRREDARPAPPGEQLNSITTFARNFTRYSYGDFLSTNRRADVMFRIWPGTQKVLLWGDPALAAGFGRLSTFGGSLGVEICEPLYFYGRKGSAVTDTRDPYLNSELQLGGHEWQKYKYTYLLWGRLLYDTEAEPEQWRGYLRFEYGDLASAVEHGLGALSRILPLVTVAHGVGASNNGYSPEMYVDLPLSTKTSPADYVWDTDGAPVWGQVSALDPGMFYSIDEFVQDRVRERVDARYSPLEVAAWLEAMVESAEDHVTELASAAEPSAQLQRTLIDCRILMCLGRFFALKFRAATKYAEFKLTRDRADLEAAVRLLESAKQAYSGISEYAGGNYMDVLHFGPEDSERGDWSRRPKAMEFDIRNLRSELSSSGAPVAVAPAPPTRVDQVAIRHTPPEVFKRGDSVMLDLATDDAVGVSRVRLRYRRVDQSQALESVDMTLGAQNARGEIPADYTDSDYSLMYFFEVYFADGRHALLPGLGADLADQPYWVVRNDG